MVKEDLGGRVSRYSIVRDRSSQDLIPELHLFHQILCLVIPHTFPSGCSDGLEVIDTELKRVYLVSMCNLLVFRCACLSCYEGCYLDLFSFHDT